MSGKRAPGTTPHTMLGHSAESSPEELLDVFKAAALSVTKLYKTSAAVQSKARIEGYQDCLEDLLALVEKGDVDVRAIRRWIVERLDGREPILPTIESEDEIEKTDGTPEPQSAAGSSNQIRGADASANNTKNNNSSSSSSTANINNDTAMQTEADAEPEADMETETETPSPSKNSRVAATSSSMAAPASTKKTKNKARNAAANASALSSSSTSTATPTDSSDNIDHADVSASNNAEHFTFRSSLQYPTNESFLEIANLDLSDRRSASGSVKDASEPPSTSATTTTTNGSTYVFNAPTSNNTTSQTDNTTSSSPSHTSGSRQFRVRHATGRPNGRSALSARYNRSSAGQKRKLNFDEIFDVASLGYGKDVFGRGGPKRSKQA